jgi:hypothetical protein
VAREVIASTRELVAARLGSEREEYFVLDARAWDALRGGEALPAREVFRVAGRLAARDDDLVVITNEWNTGEWEGVFPNKSEREAKLPTVLPPSLRRLRRT